MDRVKVQANKVKERKQMVGKKYKYINKYKIINYMIDTNKK